MGFPLIFAQGQAYWDVPWKRITQLKLQIHILAVFFLLPGISIGQEPVWDFEPDNIRRGIRKIAEAIGKKNEIHTKAIGYRGKRTRQYDRFARLVKKAETAELVALMKHPKPAVRGYAFWGLAKRHFEGLEEIFVAHANDEELVFNMQGCMGGDAPVIEFMGWVVMPHMLDSNCMKLNNSAFERVRVVRRVLNEPK